MNDPHQDDLLNQAVEEVEGAEREQLEELLDSLPESELAKSLARRGSGGVARVSQMQWQAPLPPAAMLQQYDDISPGFADRIITSSEKEQDHRHYCEKSGLGASIQAEQRGQYLAFAIAVVMIAITASLIYLDKNIGASIFGSVTLLGLVSIFATGRLLPSRRSDDDVEEQQD
ncbi:MAG: DUF2335 domain-containing protein [Pseudomonadota bacterium]